MVVEPIKPWCVLGLTIVAEMGRSVAPSYFIGKINDINIKGDISEFVKGKWFK